MMPAEHNIIIANRYRLEGTLGTGGMAVVYQAFDVSTGRRVALKQLDIRPKAEKQQRMRELFEREFHTLSHLSHPKVIEVYDYGIDQLRPFYTMELLDGVSLKQLSKVEWKKACHILIDVCSALSLLHSRRMVHRDLSPSNIHWSKDGHAKLIDFGAMVPMGPCKQVVGTASYVAPEVLHLQSLDGRTDLYSLGATIYYALTGRNAYQAKEFEHLRRRWRVNPPPPSEIISDIPKALDNLVMSLIHLDPAARPANAAEVMERASVIAGRPIDEQLLVSQAYLSTPTLVGRNNHLDRLRRLLVRTQRNHGSTLLVRGASGVGRSRFIDACVLEGKLMGATVIRADATHGRSGDYGVIQTLVTQLLEAAPKATITTIRPYAKILGHLLPKPLEVFRKEDFDNESIPQPSRASVQSALCECFFELSRRHRLLIAVDDLHGIDEPSAAVIAFLSHKVARHPIVIVVSTETGVDSTSVGALKLLSASARRIELENLTAEETEKLLGSVFGEVPNLERVADKLYKISKGNPRDVMQLAQHLVDKKKVSYQSGAWSLPDKIDSEDLPSNMAQALLVRLASLSADARQLASIMALSPQHRYSFNDCLVLSMHDTPALLIQTLEELVTNDVLRSDAEHYVFSQHGFVSALVSESDINQHGDYHLRLTKMFEFRGGDDFREAQHLLYAGEEERGFDKLIDYSESSREITDKDPEAYNTLIQALPQGWFETYLKAIRIGKKLGRPPLQIFTLQSRWCSFAWLSGTDETEDISEMIQQLIRDSGLNDYEQLDASMDQISRISRAIETAQERYNSTIEEQRVLEPAPAIRKLAGVMVEVSAMILTTCNHEFWESLPTLGPLTPLSPALQVVDKLSHALGNRIVARGELACQEYREILDLLARPDNAGLNPSHYIYASCGVMRGIALVEAAMGLESSLDFADRIGIEPTFEVNAMLIRMLYYLWQGDTKKTKHYRRRAEILQIQKGSIHLHEGAQLSREIMAYALSDDLTGVKRHISAVEDMAARYRAWIPTLRLTMGEFHRIRGDYRNALTELEQAIKTTEPGRHQNWADIIGAYLKALLELERYNDVRSFAQTALAAGEEAQLGYMCNYIRMPLAIAEVRLGEYDNAIADAMAVVESFRAMGSKGINIGLAYETRARIALYMNDEENFEKYSALCYEEFCSKGNQALIAKYEKLMKEIGDSALGETVATRTSLTNQLKQADVSELLRTCRNFEERARCILQLLLDNSDSTEGFLYTMQKEGPTLSAQIGSGALTKDLEATVRRYLSSEIDDSLDITITGDASDSTTLSTTAWTGHDRRRYRPLLLGHHTNQGYVITGLAVLPIYPGDELKFPVGVVIAVSRSLFEYGDVERCFAASSTSLIL